MLGRGLLLVLCVGITFAAVAKKDRVYDPKLSEAEPGSQEYDHDAFVGQDQAPEFDELSPEESKRRLEIIAKKIDKNNDGFVTEDELKDWIVFTQQRYIREDTKRQFEQLDTDKDGKVKWEEYKDVTYGFLTEEDINSDDEEQFSYKNMIARDQNRWNKADVDQNNMCSEEEFQAFLHPEEFERMKEVVAKETLEDIDKDKDGLVSLEEYIGDMYTSENEDEPEWVKTEREQFTEHRDFNKDGKMDLEEVSAWILPQGYDHASAEATHLIYESDMDKDKQLTIQEILDKYDNFVGSQVTDFGDALKRHDEF